MRNGLARAHLAVLIGAALVVCAPVLWRGAPARAHDGAHHARWSNQFCRQLWGGEAYPRWLADENGGLGGAAFFFYPPLPFYAGCAVWPAVRAHDPYGWRTAGISFTLAMLLSGLTAYLWLRDLTGERAALFGALFYLLAPYHAAIDLYTRGALSETWSVVWMPLVLLFTMRVVRGERWALRGLAISYALLVFSHLAVTLIFSPVVLILAMRNRALLRVAAALALGASLAAIYLVPAMLTQSNVSMEVTNTGFYDYHHWWIVQPPLTPFKTWMLVTAAATAAYAAALYRFSRFYVALAAAALFFMTPLSEPVWWLFEPLKMLQFPWRFNVLLVLAAAALSGLAHARISRVVRAVILCAAAIATVPPMLAAFSPSPPIDDLQREEAAFWPRAALARFPARVVSVDPAGSAAVESWRARHIVLQVDIGTDARLTLAHFFYPGWRGWIDQNKQAVAVRASEPEGFMQMDVPPGRYTLSLELGREPPERWGGIVSLVALVLLAVGSAVTAFSRA